MSLWGRVFAERRRTVLALLTLIVVNAAVLGFAVLPLRNVVASSDAQAALVKMNLAQAQAKLTLARQARSSRDRADVDLKRFYADILPADFASARHITHLEIARIGQDAGLKPGPRDFEPQRVKDSQLGEFKTSVSFSGEYPSLRKFIYEVETSPSFLVIRRVAMAPAGQAKGNTGVALTMTMEVSTFFLGGK